LNLVNDTFEKSSDMKDEYYHYYQIVNIRDTEKQIKGLEFLFIELPKFKPLNRAEKMLHELWMRFLTEINEDTKKVPKELLDNALTCEAIEYIEKAAYTKEQLEAYDKWKINAMTERSALNDAKKEGRAEGWAEGRVEGEAIGVEKGRVEGRAEGRVEGEAIGMEKGRVEGIEKVVDNCHIAGYSIENITTITGLTREEIIRILQRN